MLPLRLLFDARTLTPHYPGVGRYGRGLLKAMAALPDVECSPIVAPGQALGAAFGGREIVAGGSVRSPLDQIRTPLSLALTSRGQRAVYHSPFYVFPYLLRLPSVVTLYDLTPLLPQAGFSASARLVYTLAHRLAAVRARRIITLAQAARADLVQRLGIPPERIVVVPPGHNPTAPAPGDAGLPPEYLLYVGINKPHKNLPRLVEAYRTLESDAPPLLIAGPQDARYPQAIQAVEAAGLQNRVHFLGHVPEDALARLYSRATVFVFPSLAEGFGFPVLEAMAHGTPVACSDIPVLRELAGEAADYFDPHSTGSLAACLQAALARPERREEQRRIGQATAAGYTWHRAAKRTVDVYRQALEAV
jgi:glycosyltransferase involved in cell wall biosynthesis